VVSLQENEPISSNSESPVTQSGYQVGIRAIKQPGLALIHHNEVIASAFVFKKFKVFHGCEFPSNEDFNEVGEWQSRREPLAPVIGRDEIPNGLAMFVSPSDLRCRQ